MNLEKILRQMREAPQNVRYADVHCVFKTPWPGDPRVNVQNKNGYAKPYQVRQVLAAIAKLQECAL